MRFAVVFLLAGCNVVFPLDPLPPPDGPPPGPKVTGTYFHRVALKSGDAIDVADVAATDATIQVRYEDGATADIVVADDGSFEFEKLSDRYTVISSIEDVTELIESSDTLKLARFEAGRSNVEPITLSQPIRFPTQGGVGGMVATVGQWASVPIGNGTSGFEWRASIGSGNLPVGLLDAREDDGLYAIDLIDDLYVDGQRAVQLANVFDDIVMVPGVEVNLGLLQGTQITGANNCATLELRLQSDIDAMMAVLPGFTPPASDYTVVAVPSAELGQVGAIPIVSRRPNNPLAVDLNSDLPIKGLNPFAGHTALAAILTSTTRMVGIPESPNLGIGASYLTLVEIPTGTTCPNPVMVESVAPAFATELHVNNTLIDHADVPIEIQRPSEATLRWTASGAFDMFDVTLLEARLVGGKFQLDPLRSFRTRVPEIRVPDTLLGSQRRFVLRVSTIIGVPKAAQGDYATLGYPFTNATIESPPFVVP